MGSSGLWIIWMALVLYLVTSVSGVPSSLPLHKMKVNNALPGNPFVDQYNRIRTFHGLNRVQKAFPWFPATLLNEDHLNSLESWGFNVVRLGMMWSGVEVKPFTVNNTYLDIMETIVKSLAQRGIYVILDMHQDGLSSKFGGYDGAPLWLVNEFKFDHPYPQPFKTKPTNWELNYATEACGDAFESLYGNKSRALDHWGFFWQTVAKRFGQYDSVLGYELINEPWPGNVWNDPTLFFPGKVGANILQPTYDTISKFIRQADSKTIIFYEPVTWGMIEHGDVLGSGFSHVPGGSEYSDRAAISFHYYCWFAGSFDDNPFPFWLRDLCDKFFFHGVMSSITQDIEDTKGGKFLTEFGLCQGSAPHDSTEYQECLNVLSHADNTALSWTYWDSKFRYDNGTVIVGTVKLFSRTYAMAVAGIPLESSFDNDSGAYHFLFMPDLSIKAPTVIYASPLHYPNGFTVVSETHNTNYTIVDSNYVEVYATSTSTVLLAIQRK